MVDDLNISVFLFKTLTTDHPSFDNGKLYNGRMDLNGKVKMNL